MLSTAALVLLLVMPADLPEAQARTRALQHQQAGQELMATERYEDAVDEFRQAIAQDPMLMLAHYNLGQAYMALKRYTEAALAYGAARDTILRMSSLSDRERGERERNARDERNEIRNTIQALQSGLIKAAQPQQQIMRLEERLRVLESMEMRGRDEMIRVPAEIDLALGSAYFRQQKYAEAEQAYAAAIKSNNKLGAAHNNLAVIYMLTGRYKDARAAIHSAEQAGFQVPPQFKADLAKREAGR